MAENSINAKQCKTCGHMFLTKSVDRYCLDCRAKNIPQKIAAETRNIKNKTDPVSHHISKIRDRRRTWKKYVKQPDHYLSWQESVFGLLREISQTDQVLSSSLAFNVNTVCLLYEKMTRTFHENSSLLDTDLIEKWELMSKCLASSKNRYPESVITGQGGTTLQLYPFAPDDIPQCLSNYERILQFFYTTIYENDPPFRTLQQKAEQKIERNLLKNRIKIN